MSAKVDAITGCRDFQEKMGLSLVMLAKKFGIFDTELGLLFKRDKRFTTLATKVECDDLVIGASYFRNFKKKKFVGDEIFVTMPTPFGMMGFMLQHDGSLTFILGDLHEEVSDSIRQLISDFLENLLRQMRVLPSGAGTVIFKEQ